MIFLIGKPNLRKNSMSLMRKARAMPAPSLQNAHAPADSVIPLQNTTKFFLMSTECMHFDESVHLKAQQEGAQALRSLQ